MSSSALFIFEIGSLATQQMSVFSDTNTARSLSDPHPRQPFEQQQQQHRQQVEAYLKRLSEPPQIIGGIQADETHKNIVIALDIDQCTAVGEDTNDVLRILSAMTRGFNDLNPEQMPHLLDVTKLLINPEMVHAVEHMRQRGFNPYIVFYTKKSGIINLMEQACPGLQGHLLERGFYLPDSETIRFGALSYRSSEHFARGKGMDYLYDQIKLFDGMPATTHRVCHELRRVALLTWGAALLLGLPYLPSVYITKGLKNVGLLASDLGVPFERVILFDDKGLSHAQALHLTPAQANMQPVQPYNFSTMSPETAHALYEELRTHFPLTPEFVQANRALIAQASTASFDWPRENLALWQGRWNPAWAAIAQNGPHSVPWELTQGPLRYSASAITPRKRNMDMETTSTSLRPASARSFSASQ